MMDHASLLDAIFANLLDTHMANMPAVDFYEKNALEIKPAMHRQLADWLLEECEAYSCLREVFPTAVVLLDRFVGAACVSKPTYQLLGATALHVASKLIGPVVVSADSLCDDMDRISSPEQMKELELLLLKTLEWRVDCARPFEFLEHFLLRLSIGPSEELKATLRAHSEVFVCLCYTDVLYVKFGPAIIAAAALHVAAFGIEGTQGTVAACQPGPGHKESFLGLLQYLPGKQALLAECVHFIETLYFASLQSPPEVVGQEAKLRV